MLSDKGLKFMVGGLDMIRKEAWPFTESVPASAYVGSSKNLKDLKVEWLD